MRKWAVVVAGLMMGCNGDKDTGGECDDGSVVTVYLFDGATGNPAMGSIEWTDSNGDSGSMDCFGECEFVPAMGAVSITATPSDAALGDPITQSTTFLRSDDCSTAVFNGIEFTW